MNARNGSGLSQFGRVFLLKASSLVSLFAADATNTRSNVLLICVDDLKPALGCYGDPLAKTPNLDRLAARGMRFELAYCNQSVCAPSRNSLLLGARSTSLGIYSLGRNFRQAAPDAVTLTQHFMRGGWRAEAVGKILHTGHGNQDDERSWSVPTQKDKVVEYLDSKNSAGGQLTRQEAMFTNQRLGEISATRTTPQALPEKRAAKSWTMSRFPPKICSTKRPSANSTRATMRA